MPADQDGAPAADCDSGQSVDRRWNDLQSRAVRWVRFVLWSMGVALLLPMAALGWLVVRYQLDLGSALHAAFTTRPSFTIDPARLETAGHRLVTWQGNVDNPLTGELSGLALSRRRADLLWALNDSGAPPALFALGTDGRDLGQVQVSNANNIDWEDLAAFELEGRPYLLIADVGDNFAWRPAITLYVVPEPELTGARFAAGASVEPLWVLRVKYADGPRDCEAVAIDPVARRVLLLSKRDVPARLYSVPLLARRDSRTSLENLLVAKLLTRVPGIPQPTAREIAEDEDYGSSRSRPTSMSLAPDRSAALVFTYKDVYRFDRKPGEGWAQALSRVPERVEMPLLEALEAGTYAGDARTFYATSEYRPTPIFRYELVD